MTSTTFEVGDLFTALATIGLEFGRACECGAEEVRLRPGPRSTASVGHRLDARSSSFKASTCLI